jgi:ABC-type transporter Mla subunit MlaD
MEFFAGAAIFFFGIIIGYGLRSRDTDERVETLEAEMDSLRGEFVPTVARVIESMAQDIKQLSKNDGDLIDAYQSVSGRLTAWVTENKTQQ